VEDETKRGAHQAVANDAWFRWQVEIAVQEADDPSAQWVSQTEIKRKSAIKRTAWLGESSTTEKAPA
jgi:hypothetical protein